MKKQASMKHKMVMGLMGLAMGLSAASVQAGAIKSFELSSTAGHALAFDGLGNFVFADEGSNNYNDFSIDLQDGSNGANLLVGLMGDIEGQFSFSDPLGSSSINVSTSPGSYLTINDGLNVLTSDIEIFTLSELGGPFGGILGSVLLSGVSYAGANADLQELASLENGAHVALTFQVSGGIDLDELYANARDVSWSGTVTVPEPGTLLLMGFGILGLGVLGRRRTAQMSMA